MHIVCQKDTGEITMSYKNGYAHNEMINAEDLLVRLERGDIAIRDSNIYPYIYTHADNRLIANGEKYLKYDDHEQHTQKEMLKIYLIETLSADDDRARVKSFRLARGMMKRLGISYNRLSQIWDAAPEHLIVSLNEHQRFFSAVEDLYNNMILDEGHMPLIKNHGGSMVENGSDISRKMRTHTHRIAKNYLRSLNEEVE